MLALSLQLLNKQRSTLLKMTGFGTKSNDFGSLDVLERPLRTLFHNTPVTVFGAHHKNLNEDRPTLFAANL